MAVRAYIRFSNVNIPRRALIEEAYIQFTAYSDLTGELDTTVYVEQNVNSSIPTNKSELDAISVSAGKAWNITENWSQGGTYNSPSVSASIQNLVNRDDWVSGNPIMVIIENENTGGVTNKRDFTSFEYNGYGASLIVNYSDPIKTADPYFDPVAGTYNTPTKDIEIKTVTSNADIYYTTDGSTPTTSSTLYSGSFQISGNTEIKSMAFKDENGYIESDIVTGNYYLPSEITLYTTAIDDDGSHDNIGGIESITTDISYSTTHWADLGKLDGGNEIYDMWMLWRNVNIPTGSTINEATVTLEWCAIGNTANNDMNFRCYFSKTASASKIETLTDWNNLTYTTNYYDLNYTGFTGKAKCSYYLEFDVTDVVNEIISLPGWSSGNDMLGIVLENGSVGTDEHGQITTYPPDNIRGCYSPELFVRFIEP